MTPNLSAGGRRLAENKARWMIHHHPSVGMWPHLVSPYITLIQITSYLSRFLPSVLGIFGLIGVTWTTDLFVNKTRQNERFENIL